MTVAAAGAAGVVWFVGGWSFGFSLATAGLVAQAAFACRIALLRSGRRELCLELVIGNGAWPPLPCVQQLCCRLLDEEARERLAGSIECLVREAARPAQAPLVVRPLAERRVIRAVAPELRDVAVALRGSPAVQGVALVEWLLTSPVTPLYGNEVEPLRQELRRARYLLAKH